MDHLLLPFRQFVLKVHSRCDLACNHCYIYEHSDQSWRGRPLGIAPETAAQAAGRIAEHATRHQLRDVHVVLHGGEPLLLGLEGTRRLLELLKRTVETEVTRLDLRIHTNAVLLDEAFLDLFATHDVKVGVSLDGDRASNDRHRLYRDGRSSYDKVVKALGLLRSAKYRQLYAGLLCTIDIANDPVDVYRGLLEQEPPRIDLLLPHATWEHLPPGLGAPRSRSGPAEPVAGAAPEYARWLRAIFDEWNASGRPVPVRTFDSIIGALHGRPSQTESLGLVPADLLVIETDGALEQADSLKTAFDGAAATGFDVWRNSLDDVATHAGITSRQQGLDGLCAACRSCPVVGVCGGGLYAHRYAPETGFDNPSVYCDDLMDLIMHVRAAGDPAGGGVGGGIPATAAVPALDPHALTAEDLDALAAGYGDAATIRRLAEPQRSIMRDLLAEIARTGPQQDRGFAEAWDGFAELDALEPLAVNETLAHPYVRAWAVHCLELLGSGRDAGADLAHLAALCVSATLRADRVGRFRVPIRDNALRLPGYGAFVCADGGAAAEIEVHPGGWVEIETGTAVHKARPTANTPDDQSDNAFWRPVRRLRAGDFSVLIEDTDVYRACHGQVAPRLSIAQVQRWQAAFAAAMTLIDEHLPRYTPGLRTGLTTITPMVAPSDGSHRSAAARHAFGAVGAAMPDDPAILALLLVHEFQHVKMGAVLDLFDLYDPSDVEARHYAPWRPDPRPLEGLLQGTYAHVAVTDFWRVRRGMVGGVDAQTAEMHFARWRVHTAEAVEQLLASGSLTGLGERFVRAMGETVSGWLGEPVSRSAQIAAQHSSGEHRAAFDSHVKTSQA